jgi:hypothetical protein
MGRNLRRGRLNYGENPNWSTSFERLGQSLKIGADAELMRAAK